jgi:hypothetical protein
VKLVAKDYDPVTKFTDEYWYDDNTNRLTIRRVQDVEDNLNHNKNEFNEYGNIGYAKSKGLHKVASIPLVIIERWIREDGFNWYKSTDAERRAKLNHRDNRFLLTRPGKL